MTSADAVPTSRASASPGEAFTKVVTTTVEYGVARLTRAADAWSRKLTSGRDGATRRAGIYGAEAVLEGRNPVWPAVKGAWTGSTATVKAAIVTALVALLLLAVLSPVVLLVFLLSLLVVAAVEQVRRKRP